MKVKINYRVSKDGEVIAVFLGKLRNDKFSCISLYDNTHFDADENYIRNCTKNATGYRISELNAFLGNRGYTPIYVSRMSYK